MFAVLIITSLRRISVIGFDFSDSSVRKCKT